MHDDPQGAATAFDRTTAVTPAAVTGDGATHTFTAELDESWSSLRGVHGGSVAAVVARAAGAVDPARAVRTLSVSFLRPHHPGPISVVLDVVRTGRQLAVLAAHVTQDGRPTLRATLTLAAAGIDAPTWSLAPADAPAPRAACVAFTPPPGIRHFAQSELLLDPATIPAGDAEDSRIAGYVRPLEPRPLDAPWLAMIGDSFPPSPFRRLAPPAGGVSVDYVVHVHRTLPTDPARWLAGVFATGTSAGGLALERGTLTTEDGVVVAETFHTRWTPVRP